VLLVAGKFEFSVSEFLKIPGCVTGWGYWYYWIVIGEISWSISVPLRINVAVPM